MKTIPSEYISSFLPIQELEAVEPSIPNTAAPVSADDLFLISQISAYATNSTNAVAVSRKISYKYLSEKISSDFSIDGIKLSIDGLSTDLSNLSSYTVNSINGLCSAVQVSANALSTYTNNQIKSLSNTVSSNYISNFTQTCSLITSFSDVHNPANIASGLYINNGRMAVTSHVSISDLIVPNQWRLAASGIGGDYSRKTELTNIANSNVFSYDHLSTDCYLNCSISAVEDDSYGPIDVIISSNIDNTAMSSVYQTLNNPGGFSGKDFTNYYHFSVPIKGGFPGNTNKVKVIVKYRDAGNKFKANSRAEITEYYCYAMPSKDDLNSYVKKPTPSPSPYPNSHVCQIHFNNDGLITNATSVYYGVATNSLCGLVKLGDFTQPNYALLLDSNNKAYVNIPHADSATYGTIKTTSSSASSNHHLHNFGDVSYSSDIKYFLSCGLSVDYNGRALTHIPIATDSNFGVVKLSSANVDPGDTSSSDYNNRQYELSAYLGTNSDGRAYVVIPYAKYDGKAIPGIIKTGTPDTTDIRVERNVYLNEKGFACVNVANQIGVGPFHIDNVNTGYTKDIELPLTTSTNTSEFTEQLSMFDGRSSYASQYGTYIYSTRQNVNSWFMAQLMYEGSAGAVYSNDDFLQIVCDGIIVTTIRPQYIRGASDKPFIYSTYLGVFKGGGMFSETSSSRLFAAISNTNRFSTDKIHFLIKEANLLMS